MGQVSYALVRFGDDELFLEARENLAALFDFGVNICGIDPDTFVNAFVASGLAYRFERMNPVYVVGKSAIELFGIMCPHLGYAEELPDFISDVPSVDYWVGWVVAHYQHETGTPYRRIFEAVPYGVIAASYHPLHEADESKFVEVFSGRIGAARPVTRLAMQRKAAGLSQAELAEQSGVSLRSIQMYEQRNKNVNHASVETVYRLAHALHCDITDLMEL